MTADPVAHSATTAVLLDIEGTTTPIAFVHDVLFPFARARLGEFVAGHAEESHVRAAIATLRDEHAEDRARGETPPVWPDAGASVERAGLVAYLEWLMDRDRKSPGLKALQGLIWEEGYRRGELRGDVYKDVAPAIRAWRARGVVVAIYSSGSELAQRRLFESTPDGDLTRLIDAFFDTRIGAKTDAESYRRIARALGRPPGEVLFISDLAPELRAARAAGCAVLLSVRDGSKGSEEFSTVSALLVPEVGPSTSGTKRAETVENSSDPFD